MFFKLALVSCVVVVCSAQYGNYGHGNLLGNGNNYGGHGLAAAPVLVHSAPAAYGHGNGYGHEVDYYAHPKYEFKYGVSDAHTNDYHSQHEVRDGDAVQGEYSLHEADGTIRTVKYTADHKNGFNAQVIRSGHAAHPQTQVKAAYVAQGYGGHY